MELSRNEDSGYLIDSLGPDFTGLPTIVYTYVKFYLDDVPELQVPSILVSNFPGTEIIWSDNNFMVSVEARPRILHGQRKLTPDELARVFEWVRINQVYLHAYWEGHTSTPELFEVLKKLKSVEEVWSEEIARRIEEIDTGRATLIPHSDVQREIRRILENGS